MKKAFRVLGLLCLLAFAGIFRVVPHRTVKWRHALAGALLAALLFELVKWSIGLYLGSFNSYQKLYGALAAAPILTGTIWPIRCCGPSMCTA